MTREKAKEIITNGTDGGLDYETLKQFFIDNFRVNNLTLEIIDCVIEEHKEAENTFTDFMLDEIASNYEEEELKTEWKKWLCD